MGGTHVSASIPTALEPTSRGRAREGYRSWSQSWLPLFSPLVTPIGKPPASFRSFKQPRERPGRNPQRRSMESGFCDNHVTIPASLSMASAVPLPICNALLRGTSGLTPSPVVSGEHCMGMECNVCKWALKAGWTRVYSLSTDVSASHWDFWIH